MILEVSCGSVEEAVLAANAGADRLEICHALSTGGVTPSLGFFESVRESVSIPVFVMVAQPEADFVVNPADSHAMARDVAHFSKTGADGFVFGCLLPDGRLDVESNRRLVEAADGKPCTFHRAFDSIADPVRTATQLAEIGFARILTSGHAPDAGEGAPLIGELITLGLIGILPGGGVRPENAARLQQAGAEELHFSIRSGTKGGGYLGYPLPTFDTARVAAIRSAIR